MDGKTRDDRMFDDGVRIGRQQELTDVIAHLRFVMRTWPPFDGGRPALHRLLADLQDGKHYGGANREKARASARPKRKKRV